jgi:hypothetical protein
MLYRNNKSLELYKTRYVHVTNFPFGLYFHKSFWDERFINRRNDGMKPSIQNVAESELIDLGMPE